MHTSIATVLLPCCFTNCHNMQLCLSVHLPDQWTALKWLTLNIVLKFQCIICMLTAKN